MTLPERDYVVVAPTDCIMNPLVQMVKTETGDVQRRLIDNPLQQDTVLDVKGIPISISDLLANAPDKLKEKFNGGSGLACVLLPNNYHHFHSPVDGTLRYAGWVASIPVGLDTVGSVVFNDDIPLGYRSKETGCR